MTDATRAAEIDTSGEFVTTLRGATVGTIDVHRVGRTVVGLCAVALAVATAALFVAGVHKNSQVTELRQHGVPVVVTVTGCQGLLGGSGSNLAGYSCSGTFAIDGHRHHEAIPGNTFYEPGTTVRAVTVRGDPALLSTVRAARSTHPSSRVFVLPAVMAAVLMLLVGVIGIRAVGRRRAGRGSRRGPPLVAP